MVDERSVLNVWYMLPLEEIESAGLPLLYDQPQEMA